MIFAAVHQKCWHFGQFSECLPFMRRIDIRRRPYPRILLHSCHFSIASRSCRHTKLSIQRFLPRFPPAISAVKMQSVPFVLIIRIKCIKLKYQINLWQDLMHGGIYYGTFQHRDLALFHLECSHLWSVINKMGSPKC